VIKSDILGLAKPFMSKKLGLWIGLGVVSIGVAQQGRRVDDSVLRNIGKTGEEWLSYGVTPQETRYSPLAQITPANVKRLGLAWSYDVGLGGGNQEATPLEWNGTVYGITNWSIVFAVDARTGKEKWRWDPEVNQNAVRAKICCGAVNRGIAIYEGKIIAPIIDGRLVGLDAETGKPLWESRVAYTQSNYSITMAPRIAKGKVIVGISGADYPVRGFFDAYDANTGKFAWRFYTIPGDPSKPFENAAMKKAAETWGKGGIESGAGGGSVWDGVAYDPDTNLVFVGTGNAGPYPEEIRKSKGLDNLYTCSILAVNADSGELKWYFQMVPGDDWDYDSVQQLMLADLTIKGKQRKVIMQANKNGFYYVLDRVSGQFISGKPFAQVTWAQGLNEETGRPIVNPEARYGTESVTISPSAGGAHNWAPMSFSPSTGLIYIPASVTGSTNFAMDANFKYKDGQNLGLGRGGSGAAPKILPAIGPEPQGERGVLMAWDPVNQKERWRAQGGGGAGGGTVATAGNIVFQVVGDGRLMAYSADKGEKLIELNTGLRGMGPPITFQLDGKQYISVMGGTGVVPPRPGRGPAQPANSGPPPLPRLLTFVIDGKGTLPVAAQ
jgi:quinohemoprotein ethanol dehydrogenase